VSGRAATSQTPSSEVVEQRLLDAARVLRETLVRVHPSFRFEERLAGRLASRSPGGTAEEVVTAQDAEPFDRATLIPFPLPAPVASLEVLPGAFDAEIAFGAAGSALDASASGDRSAWWGQLPRGALIGGAIASGFSIAGAALLARRWRQRPPRVAHSGRGAA
jgi:hypothetical protein